MIFNLWILVLGLGLFLAVDARRLQQPIGIDLGPELLSVSHYGGLMIFIISWLISP